MSETAELDMFESRTMVEAIRQTKPPERFILDTFFPVVKEFDTRNVDMEIWKDKRRIAPFTNPLDTGKPVNSIGYKVVSVQPGYVKPFMRTTAQELLKKPIGQNIYAPVDPSSRAAAKLGEDLASLDDMIVRREEYMALLAMLDGEVDIVGDGINRTVSFDFDATHFEALTGTDVWDNAASDPIADLLEWRLIVLRDSGRAPDVCIMGDSVAQAFLKHAKVQDLFNKWNVHPGEIDITASGNVISYGYIKMLGMSIYTLNEFFIDPADSVEKQMFHAKKLVMTHSGARRARYYGAIENVDALVGISRFPSSWTTKNPSARFVMLESAPLPVIEQPDAHFSAQVLA